MHVLPPRTAARLVALTLGAAVLAGTSPQGAWAEPRTAQPRTAQARAPKPKPATQADVERLERKIADQQRLIEKLIRLQQQYLQSLSALLPEGGSTAAVPTPDVVAKVEPRATPPAPTAPRSDAAIETGGGTAKPEPRPAAKPPRPSAGAATAAGGAATAKKPSAKGTGTVVGKVKGGGGDIYVYVADVFASGGGTAVMKQEGKQFVPRVLAVQKGTRVEFPNLDAVFHNVFSVTPEASFDLGSYRQGESKSVTMSKPGVVSVYCNMHPQMVGYILVVPSSLYTRAGADGFYRLANVPAGRHKIVAWAPNSKPVAMEVDVAEDEVTTLELEVKRGRAAPHKNKDGLPYGSYKD